MREVAGVVAVRAVQAVWQAAHVPIQRQEVPPPPPKGQAGKVRVRSGRAGNKGKSTE